MTGPDVTAGHGRARESTPVLTDTLSDLARQGTCVLRFRYLPNGGRWENDRQADTYADNEFGGSDSVLDLTDARLQAESTLPTPARRDRDPRR